MRLQRRTLLAALGLGALGGLTGLSACATTTAVPAAPTPPPSRRPVRHRYGNDPAQYADLYQPDGTSRGVVVVLHGGYWRSAYDATLGAPLAADLAERGWTAWNLEYRRVGGGGGWPATFDDVAAGIDALADVRGLDLTSVTALGHSAGGHLAAWSAARGRYPRWRPERVAVTAVVSQAGVLDLTRAYEDDLGGGAVGALMGGPPGPAYDRVDPQRQLPLDVPLWAVHGRDDRVVPFAQSADYVKAATAAGATATLVPVTGDHVTVIDPGSAAWRTIVRLLPST